MSRSRSGSRGRRRGRLAAGLVVVVPLGMAGMVAAAGPAEALPSGCSQTGITVTCTFSYTGAAQTFTVPSGVRSITVTADGAAGGASGGLNYPHAAGGPGGQVHGTLAVTPGAVLQVNVGGQGGTDGSEAGGFNGGGSGGGMSSGNIPELAGGGGGASDVRGGSGTLADRLLVAAGGGGGGGNGAGTGGGDAGGVAGGPGGASNSPGTTGPSVTGATGGGMGLAGSQGTGGTGGNPSGKTGGDGGLGTGGNGGGGDFHGGDGGGGGGGYHGGGAGGGGGDYDQAHLGAGGGGGGGGSDYTGAATDLVVSDGVQSGNGQVTITYTDDDLAIAQPANITVDATSPSGATVTYPAPAVTDDDSSPPAAVCAPKPGSVFGIGTTTVICTVTDTDDSPSTVSASFTVTVKGAAAQLADLVQAVRGTSLKSTVAAAQTELAAGRPRLACVLLGVFIFEAEGPFGIRSGTAAALVADATRIRAVLGCGTSLF